MVEEEGEMIDMEATEEATVAIDQVTVATEVVIIAEVTKGMVQGIVNVEEMVKEEDHPMADHQEMTEAVMAEPQEGAIRMVA